MKKFLLAAITLTAGLTAQAQNGLHLLPGSDWDYSWAECISTNGRYVGGTMYNEMNAFVYDTQTQTMKIFDLEDEDYGAEVRGISNDGLGAGYDGPGKTFSPDGTVTTFEDGSFLNGITPDGNFKVGALYDEDYAASACYWDAANARHTLPEPTSERAGYTVGGSQAYWVSADSSVIAGYLNDDYAMWPPLIWRRNRDAQTYSVVIMYKDYFDWDTSTGKPYSFFQPSGLSENGKWLALTVTTNSDDAKGGFARYNIETDQLEVFICDENSEEFAGYTDPYAQGIANDGTLVGFTAYGDGREGFIWEAGSSKPELLRNKYSNIEEFVTYDEGGFHSPCGISADGRYVCGSAVTVDEDENYMMTSYVLDREQTATGINVVTTQPVSRDAVEKHFSIDGKRISGRMRGLNIVTRADGRTVKVLAR